MDSCFALQWLTLETVNMILSTQEGYSSNAFILFVWEQILTTPGTIQ